MNIKFRTLYMENFMSYKQASIQLDKPGYTLITGINENPTDNAQSNGVGKSSLLEAIVWALTGETIRGSKDVSNHYTDDGAFVDLLFEIDKNEYEILRSKDHSKYKTNLKLLINGEDKSGKGIRDTSAILKEYLPDLTSNLIGSIIILGQGLPQRFTNNTPSGRKEVLEKLSKSDFMIAELKDRIAARKVELDKKLRSQQDDNLKNNSEIESLQNRNNNLKQSIEELSNLGPIDDEIEIKKQSLSDLKVSDEFVKNTINKLQVKQDELNQALLKNKEDSNNEVNEYLKDHIRDLSNYQTKAANLNAEYNQAIKELRKIENITDVCPTCGHKLEGVEKPDPAPYKQKVEDLKYRLDEVQNFIQTLSNSIEDKRKELLSKWKENENSLKQELNSVKEELSSANSSARTSANTIAQVGKDIAVLEQKKQNAIDNLQNFKDELEDNERKIDEIQKKILYNNMEKENTESRLDVIGKMNTIITRDFRGFLLTNVIEFIDRKSKEYSLDLFGTDKLLFALDGNNIAISYDGKDYECLSGGEKQKVDLIVQFALRDMLCSYLNFSSNILALDELTDNLDSVGAEKLFNLISKKLNDVESIYIISHHASDFAIPVDNELVIRKGANSISYIE